MKISNLNSNFYQYESPKKIILGNWKGLIDMRNHDKPIKKENEKVS